MRPDQIRGALVRDRHRENRQETALLALAALVRNAVSSGRAWREASPRIAAGIIERTPAHDAMLAQAVEDERVLLSAIEPPDEVIRRSARPGTEAEIGQLIASAYDDLPPAIRTGGTRSGAASPLESVVGIAGGAEPGAASRAAAS